MSDTNSLDPGGRGSFLNMLAHPAQLNVLGAYQSAAQTAGDIYKLRGAQAQEAIGQALQQSTDPQTGVVDYNKFRSLAAADPRAAMGMQAGLIDAAQLDTNAYNLHMSRLGRGSAAMGQLLADYPHGVPADVAGGVVDNAVAIGDLTPAEGAALKARLGSDPIKNSQFITQMQFRNLSGQEQLNASRPRVGTVETGQGVQGYTSPPQGSVLGQQGTITPQGARISTGLMTPKDMLEPETRPVYGEDAQKLGVPSGTQVTRNKGDWAVLTGKGGLLYHGVPGGAGAPAGPGQGNQPPIPPPPGTRLRSAAGTYPQPGGGAAQPPPPPPAGDGSATPPPAATGGGDAATAAPPPPPPAAGGSAAPPPRTPASPYPASVHNDEKFGPGPGAQPPAQPPPSPAAAPAPAAPAPAAAAAESDPYRVGRPMVAGTPGGEEDVKAYKAAQIGLSNERLALHAGEKAMQALDLVEATGPLTADINRVKSFFLAQGDTAAASRIDSAAPAVQYQIARKELLNFARLNGGPAGTDLSLQTQLSSNPNVDSMLLAANKQVLADQIALKRRSILSTLEAPEGGIGYGKHVSSFPDGLDLRALQMDFMTPQQWTAIKAELDKPENKEAKKRFNDTLRLANKYDMLTHHAPQPPPPASVTTRAPAAAPPPASPPPPPPASNNALYPIGP